MLQDSKILCEDSTGLNASIPLFLAAYLADVAASSWSSGDYNVGAFLREGKEAALL